MATKQTIIIKKKTEIPVETEKIKSLLNSIRFGSLVVRVENGKIIQVDKNEKIRFK